MVTTIWSSVTWAIASAGGFTAYILLSLAVILGLALSLQLQSPARWPRLVNSEMHNFLTLLSLIFIVIHVLAVWIDPYTKFGWSAILVPFVSTYRPLGMALGIVALYLGIAVGISTWIRPYIGYKVWRSFHIVTLGVFALAALHGMVAGSNSTNIWAVGMYVVSISTVSALFIMRLRKSAQPKRHQAVQAGNANRAREQGQVMTPARSR